MEKSNIEKSNNLEKITMTRLAERTASDLADTLSNLEPVYIALDTRVKQGDTELQGLLVSVANAFSTLTEWSEYYNHFNEIVVKDYNYYKNLANSRKEEINRLQKDNQKFLMENQALKDRYESNNNYQKLLDTISGQVDGLGILAEAIKLVNDNSKALSMSKKMKEEPRVNMHGAGHPRYDLSIDNEKLIEDYESGMKLKDLSNKYKLSIPGIRNRLMDLGVYKQVYKK